MRDFHQEVTFKQYFYLHQQFIFLCANCLIVSLFFLFFFLCVCVCVCLDYSRTNEQIFITSKFFDFEVFWSVSLYVCLFVCMFVSTF